MNSKLRGKRKKVDRTRGETKESNADEGGGSLTVTGNQREKGVDT